MEISNITTQTNYAVAATATDAAAEVKSESTAEQGAVDTQAAAVYEKSEETDKKTTYSINSMSAEERAALVQQLKDDQASREKSLIDIVKKMMTGQAKKSFEADDQNETTSISDLLDSDTEDDSIWKFLASGEYTVDEATQKQAQEDISEDGYWGVAQTSQRIFDFASALAGDDVEKMKKMQAAVEEGYNEAMKMWGKELPDISKDTYEATNKLFEEYYKSKSTEA